jgi:hypothetical protein
MSLLVLSKRGVRGEELVPSLSGESGRAAGFHRACLESAQATEGRVGLACLSPRLELPNTFLCQR